MSWIRSRSIKRFWVPTLIAVHPENDPNGDGFEQAKAYATGGWSAKLFVRCRGKIRFNGRTTILCGMLQTGSILCFDKMVEELNLRMLQS
jgi:ketol-acid reductoisomerase